MTDTLFSARDAAALFPRRAADAHKGTFGYIALIGGSVRYCGAIRLANLAACAMRAGAGVTRLCAPKSLCPAIMPQILESTLFPLSEREGGLLFREEEFREALKGIRAAAFGMGAGRVPSAAAGRPTSVLWGITGGFARGASGIG